MLFRPPALRWPLARPPSHGTHDMHTARCNRRLLHRASQRARQRRSQHTQAPAHPARTGRRPASSPPGKAGWTTHAKPFKIVIHPLEDGEDPEDDDDVPMMDFVFAHTPRYPDEPPCVRLKSARGLSDADIAAATAVVEAEAAANLGMAMVFTLVQARGRERERGGLCALRGGEVRGPSASPRAARTQRCPGGQGPAAHGLLALT